MAGDTIVQASTTSDHWRLQVDGTDGATEADHGTASGWADAFTVADGGDAQLDYDTPMSARSLVVAQVVAWLLALAVALRMRFGVITAGLDLLDDVGARCPSPTR